MHPQHPPSRSAGQFYIYSVISPYVLFYVTCSWPSDDRSIAEDSDPNNLRLIFSFVADTLLHNHLKKAGLLWHSILRGIRWASAWLKASERPSRSSRESHRPNLTYRLRCADVSSWQCIQDLFDQRFTITPIFRCLDPSTPFCTTPHWIQTNVLPTVYNNSFLPR